jgi:hypothetical protein
MTVLCPLPLLSIALLIAILGRLGREQKGRSKGNAEVENPK